MIIIHCGTNDINHYVNVNQLITKVHATLREIFQQVKKVSPKTKILWSDVIHRVHTKGVPQPFAKMFVNNLNAVAQMLVVMEEFDFISHPNINLDNNKLFRNHLVSQDHVHLSPLGYQLWFSNMDKAVSKFIKPKDPVPLLHLPLVCP